MVLGVADCHIPPEFNQRDVPLRRRYDPAALHAIILRDCLLCCPHRYAELRDYMRHVRMGLFIQFPRRRHDAQSADTPRKFIFHEFSVRSCYDYHSLSDNRRRLRDIIYFRRRVRRERFIDHCFMRRRGGIFLLHNRDSRRLSDR